MINFLTDFLNYFFPTSEMPEWLLTFCGLLLLTIFAKLILAFTGK